MLLEILVILLLVALIITIWKYSSLKSVMKLEIEKHVAEAIADLEKEVAERTLANRQELERWAQEETERRFEEWKRNALQVELEKWRATEEERIRMDAIARSLSTTLGRVSEQIAPLYMLAKLGVNPKDARFIGSPIDFIAFKGLEEGRPEKILLIDVKTSKTSELTKRQEMIKRLVDDKQVEWVTFNLRELIEETVQTLKEETMEEARYQKEEMDFETWLRKEIGVTPEEYQALDERFKMEIKDTYLKRRAGT